MYKKIFVAALLGLLSGTALAAGKSAQVTGTLHGVDAQKRILNIDHPAVPEFQWPPMRMDFTVGKGLSLEGLKPPQQVRFTLTQSDDGQYAITEIAPVR
ncbi:MAG: copper-binding protein [Magnetococcales bacterium]|nr:copper-binding protein [Magnetococcales bacterium]